MGRRYTFDEVAKYARDYWGLTLTRCSPTNRGYWSGCWKSGYSLLGPFPGYRHTERRYSSIAAVARAIQMPSKDHPNA